MFRAFSRQFLFSSSSKSYERYLNDHIRKTLQAVSTPGKIKSKQTCQTFFNYISQSHESQNTIKTSMNMVYSAAFQLQNFDSQRQVICQMILDKKIQSQSQLDRIVKFVFKEIKWNNKIGQKQIEAFLMDLDLKYNRFSTSLFQDQKQKSSEFTDKNLNNLCKKYREEFPQIDSKLIYDSVNQIIQSKKLVKQNQTSFKDSVNIQQKTAVVQQNKFWDKIQNIKPRLIKQELNTPQIFEKHKAITNGRLRFRFPPEPNGYLHIGHVKSIRMNFQTAKRLNGECYLRYDDTNPEKETPEFIEEIQRNVKWMGYTPDKINFTSDYFEHMLQFANQLVKEGKAYVCESSQEEIQLERKEKKENPFRLRSKQFSQKIFPYLHPNQTLRLKLDPSSPNPTLRDPIIYRYKHHPHPKTGQKYKIYPMYDFAHCISDSLEHIDYSLCSLQFEIRRQLYYRILDMLGLYKPIVWQFSRLNVKGNVISKRKIKQLIDDKKIEGWDDPRLLTIKGMQRRGYTAKMLSEFIDKVNSSRSGNQKYVRFEVLEREMKKELSKNCVKMMALKNPVKVQLRREDKIPKGKQEEKGIRENYINVQKEQIQRCEQGQQLILKQSGVYRLQQKTKDGYILIQSQKSVQSFKSNKQKIPILSWLPDKIQQVKVTYFNNLMTQNDEYNENSRTQGRIYVSIDTQRQIKREQQYDKIFLFERIAYFKKDQKTKEVICCVQI